MVGWFSRCHQSCLAYSRGHALGVKKKTVDVGGLQTFAICCGLKSLCESSGEASLAIAAPSVWNPCPWASQGKIEQMRDSITSPCAAIFIYIYMYNTINTHEHFERTSRCQHKGQPWATTSWLDKPTSSLLCRERQDASASMLSRLLKTLGRK